MVSNHHTAPGKKLWIWGNSPFASKWCENLTDDGSEYCELMTGCYTDNQPDFTMIEPYEKKEFETTCKKCMNLEKKLKIDSFFE